jgi:hypothetical protein
MICVDLGMGRYITLLLFISVAFSQLSIEGKRIYNNKINKYYSHDELITFLEQDSNFVGNKDFLKYKNSVQPKFYCMMPVYAFSALNLYGGIEIYNHPENYPDVPPDDYKNSFTVSVVVPLSYYIFNKVRRDNSLYYVFKNYNNLYSEEKNYNNLYSEEKLPASKLPYTWSGGMSFGFQSEKTPFSFFNLYRLFRLNEHQEIFTGVGTIMFGGGLFTGYKHYLNDFSKPSPYMSISYHGGVYYDTGAELTGIFPSLGFSLPISKNSFLNFGIGYVFMQKNTMNDFRGKKGFVAPFLNYEMLK